MLNLIFLCPNLLEPHCDNPVLYGLRMLLQCPLSTATHSQYQPLRSRAQKRPGRPRGHPPRRPRRHTTTTSSRQIARDIDTRPSITSNCDSDAPTAHPTSDVDQGASHVQPHCCLRWNRVTRSPCGTCGFRDCICLMALNKSSTIPTGPQKAPVSPKPHPLINNGRRLVSRVLIRAEKTYT